MEIRWLTVTLDTPRGAVDTEPFWQRVTGMVRSPRRGDHGEFATLVPPDGDAFMRMQRVESGDPSCHVDVHVDDVRAALRHATAVGATAVGATAVGATTVDDRGGTVILSSPGGQPFCLVPHHGEHSRPAPLRRPGGHHSLVDQVCVDVPPAVYERETAFWSALCGWEKRPGSLLEFEYLARPADMPLRFLLQKLDDAAPGQRVRMHIDIACDDVEAEASQHTAFGATFVRQRSWITLRDPVGREYCVTDRNPFTGTNPD